MGTSNSFKISGTTVYICPFKTNDVKMKSIFSLKVTIKVIWHEILWHESCCDLNYAPFLWLPFSLAAHMELPPYDEKNLFSLMI